MDEHNQIRKEYERKLEEVIKRYKDGEQQVTKKNYELDKSRKEYERKLEQVIKQYRSREGQLTKKNFMVMVIAAITIAAVVGSYPFLLIELGVVDITKFSELKQIKSGFFTQDLKGDSMESWAAWLLPSDTLYVNIQNADEYPEKTLLIDNVIKSKEKITKNPFSDNDAVYYKGWEGALESINFESVERQIPKKFSIIEDGDGDVTITLTDLKNNDGLLGTTTLRTDADQNQILKAHITIYEVDALSDEDFETIFRHEFGHAIGLAHSSAVEDLMHSTIKTDFPYISQCNIDAVVSLYDGNEPGQVICEN